MAIIYETEEFALNNTPLRVFLHHLEGVDIYTILHWHQCVELALTTKGRILSTVGRQTFVVDEGEWSVTNTGVLHANHWVDLNDVYEGIVVQIGKGMLDQWFGKDVQFSVPKTEEGKAAVRSVIEEIGDAIKAEEDEFRQMELVFRLFSKLKKYCLYDDDSIDSDRMAADKIKEILIYVDHHFSEEIDLGSVAEHFHYTPEHLARLFKKNTGITFHQHLQNTRLMEAIHDLQRNPDAKLLDCAIEHGFPSAKSFIQTFKQNMGCTPSEWKKQRSRLIENSN